MMMKKEPVKEKAIMNKQEELVKGFIITSNYSYEDNKSYIHLFGRLTCGKSFEARIPMTDYFFIKSSDELSAKKLVRVQVEQTSLKTMSDEDVVKVLVNNPKDLGVLKRLFEDNDIVCYEADIKTNRKFLIDMDLFSTVSIKGFSQKGELTDVLFVDCVCEPFSSCRNDLAKSLPKVLSIDIETNETAQEIYSVGFYGEGVSEVALVAYEGMDTSSLKNAVVFSSEDQLLRYCFKRIQEVDPDIITGWHLIDFDLKVLMERAKKYGVPFVFGRGSDPVRLRIESSFFRDSSVNCQGRLVLDGIHILKSSFIRLDDYKLNTAAKHFLNDSKLIEEDNRFGIIDKLYREDPQSFIDYNLKDAELVYDILYVSGLLELTIDRSLLTGLHMDEVKASIASFDSLYLRELRKKGFVALSTRISDSSQGLGGYVIDSKPDIYSHVLVFDFKSLYPSLMRTFAIDPLAYQGTVEEVKKKGKDLSDKNRFIIAPNSAVFDKDLALLPSILKRMWDERESARKRNDEFSRYAIKIHMNSLYGVLASPNSRFHIRNLSNAITFFAQLFVKLLAKEVEKKGFEVIYGDTDSVFVASKAKDSFSAFRIGKQLQDELNDFFKKYIFDEYCQESVVELEVEKQFEKFFLPRTRGSSSGAKKRYAGLKIINDLNAEKEIKTKMDFTGLEFVRSDWTDIAKEFQLTLLEMVFANKDPKEYIRGFVEDIKRGKYDELLVYRKSLRKELEQYTKTTPPHVKAARLLDKVESNIISYVLTKDGPQPIEKITSTIDYEHYIEKQIKPIADSILEFFSTDFDDVLNKSEQKGLGSFM